MTSASAGARTAHRAFPEFIVRHENSSAPLPRFRSVFLTRPVFRRFGLASSRIPTSAASTTIRPSRVRSPASLSGNARRRVYVRAAMIFITQRYVLYVHRPLSLLYANPYALESFGDKRRSRPSLSYFPTGVSV